MKPLTLKLILTFLLAASCFWWGHEVGKKSGCDFDHNPPEPNIRFTVETNPSRDPAKKAESEASHVQVTDYEGKVWVLQKGFHIKAILPTDRDELTNGCIVQITQPPYLRDYMREYSITFAEPADVVAKRLGVNVAKE